MEPVVGMDEKPTLEKGRHECGKGQLRFDRPSITTEANRENEIRKLLTQSHSS